MLVYTLHKMVYETYKYENYMWIRSEVKPDVFEYWEYVLCYVDDVLSIIYDQKRKRKYIKANIILRGDR